MAIEFLSDEQAARYGVFRGAPLRADLKRYFFLDDADREMVQAKRRAHNRLGFAVQLTSVRYLGRFMPDPRQVPVEVAVYLAEQLGNLGPVVFEGVRGAGRDGPNSCRGDPGGGGLAGLRRGLGRSGRVAGCAGVDDR